MSKSAIITRLNSLGPFLRSLAGPVLRPGISEKLLLSYLSLRNISAAPKQNLAILTERIESLEGEMDACRQATNRLKEDNIRLIKVTADLKLSIERLKALDIEIERKRKSLR